MQSVVGAARAAMGLLDKRAQDANAFRSSDEFVAKRRARSKGEATRWVLQAQSPRLEVMPERLWRDHQVPEYGLPLH